MDDKQWKLDYAARKKAEFETNMGLIRDAHAEAEKMNRADLTHALFWLSPGSGTGYGIASFTGMLIQRMQSPKRREDDWKFVVAIKAETQAHATDDELRWLLAFSQIKTAQFDRICGYPRMGTSMYIMGVDRWGDGPKTYFHKRQSWESGKYWSETMSEAIEFSAQVAL